MPKTAKEAVTLPKVLLVSHITDLSGPTEALARFLKPRAKMLGIIYHPFHYCADRRSRGELYRNGRRCDEKQSGSMSLPQFLTFFKDVLLSLYFFMRFKTRFDVYLGVDPLNAMVGIVLKRLGLVKSVIFYTIDWMPQRFPNRLLNAIYHMIDRFCVRNCDAAWNISPRIVLVREQMGLAKSKNILVPVGVETEKIKLPREARKTSLRRLVLLGALTPSKGVDLVVEAYPAIKEKHPDLELVVIGRTPLDAVEDGIAYEPYEIRLRALGDSVKLLGVKSHDEVLKLLPDFDIGLALYKPDPNNLSLWADPSRVKDYLACGLPVIITDVPEIARDIAEHQAGIVIHYTPQDLVRAIGRLSHPGTFRKMRENAIRYMKNYSWESIFTRAFHKSMRVNE